MSAGVGLGFDPRDYIIAAHWRDLPEGLWRWPDFSPAEMASKGDGSLLLSIEAMTLLQLLRDTLASPIVVLSAYRDPLHNARVGGAPKSRHKEGDAFDLLLTGHDRHKLRALAEAIGFRGFGLAQNFLHIDLGARRVWDYGKQARLSWNG